MSRVSVNTLQPSSILEVILDIRVTIVIFTKVARVVYEAWFKICICSICDDSHINEGGG